MFRRGRGRGSNQQFINKLFLQMVEGSNRFSRGFVFVPVFLRKLIFCDFPGGWDPPYPSLHPRIRSIQPQDVHFQRKVITLLFHLIAREFKAYLSTDIFFQVSGKQFEP